jgi:8-oxo-dGTP diphosphatase
MMQRRVSVIIFFDSKKRILLQDRTGINKSINLDWGYFGGGIEGNETPEQAVVRETKEELDFDLKDFKYIGEYSGIVNEKKYILYAFISPLEGKLSKFNQKEGIGMRLFSLEEAERLNMNKHDKDIIRDLRKIL